MHERNKIKILLRLMSVYDILFLNTTPKYNQEVL